MRRFSGRFGWPRGCEPDMSCCPLCSVDTKKPQHRQVFQDRENSWVHYSISSAGLYGNSRRSYSYRIAQLSSTTRFPPSKANRTPFTVSSARVFEAKGRSTLGHLLCTKTTDVSAKEFEEGRKQENKIMNEKLAEKEKEEKEGKEKEEKEEEKAENKEGGKEKEEEKETEKEEEKVGEKEVPEEKEDKKQEGQEEGDKDKGEKERWWLLQKTNSHDFKEKQISGSHVQGKTPRTVTATAEMTSTRQTYRPQEGNQPCQDLPNYKDVNALVCPRKHSRDLSCSSSHSQSRDNRQDGEDVPRCPQPDSALCATLQETSLKKEVELTGLLGFTPSQEPQKEKLGRKPQASVPRSPATPMPALKKPCKRKGDILKLHLPPSRLPPTPALLQLLCDQFNLPPPPKIPRTDTQRESSSIKNKKLQPVQIPDKVNEVLQPNTQVVATGTAPQPILPRPPSDSVPAVSGVPSSGHPASMSLLCQAARPPTPSVSPSPPFSPSIPTIPISPSALPSDSLPSCQAKPCVETPPDVKKKGPTDSATALAPAISHLPRPGAEALSYNPPSCRRESASLTCIASDPSLPYSAAPSSSLLRKPPAVSSTMAFHGMCWEPSPWPAEMDMDTTPPSEATILSPPTVSIMAAPIPSQAAMDIEEMDTTPPSKAAILHSFSGAKGASNSLPHPSM